MEYSIEEASKEIGKRVIVSVRMISPDKEAEYSGFWGVIHSAHEEGILLTVEGGSPEEFEMLPPDLSFLQKAENEFYQLNDDEVVENVDYEVYLAVAEDPNHL